MVSTEFTNTVNKWKWSKGSIDIRASDSYQACKQLRDALEFWEATHEELVYILDKLVDIGIVKRYDNGYYTNDEFDWDEYEGGFLKDVRYLVSCELSTIEEPGIRKRNVIVNWNGLNVDKLYKSIKTELCDKFKDYSIYVTNLVKIDLVNKE